MKENFKVYSLGLDEIENINRGYCSVYLEMDNEFYNLNFYNLTRLRQDSEKELEESSFFGIEPNIIIVKETSTKEINLAIKKLIEQKYFEMIKPLDRDDFTKLNLKNIIN